MRSKKLPAELPDRIIASTNLEKGGKWIELHVAGQFVVELSRWQKSLEKFWMRLWEEVTLNNKA